MVEQAPSGRELEILKVLWERGPSSVREVHEALCPNGELAFNTIQTLMRIMDEKGLVHHHPQGRTFIYTANYSRDRETARFLDQVFDGAVGQCVLSLLESKNVKKGELDELERILAEARGGKAKTPRTPTKRKSGDKENDHA